MIQLAFKYLCLKWSEELLKIGEFHANTHCALRTEWKEAGRIEWRLAHTTGEMENRKYSDYYNQLEDIVKARCCDKLELVLL